MNSSFENEKRDQVILRRAKKAAYEFAEELTINLFRGLEKIKKPNEETYYLIELLLVLISNRFKTSKVQRDWPKTITFFREKQSKILSHLKKLPDLFESGKYRRVQELQAKYNDLKTLRINFKKK